MPPKPVETSKTSVVIPSKHASKSSNKQDVENTLEETEIAAQISIPQDGGWAWMVLFASFMSIFILDGITFTFGSILYDIAHDLNVEDPLIALVNSVQCALYFSLSPLASALINRFGFRAAAMIGSVVCSTGLLGSYLSNSVASLLLFNSVVTGFGCALINMAAGLVVGFYFERLRAIALAISACGTSAGITLFFPLQVELVKLGGWRTVMLLNSGLYGIVFFLGMTFRPLVSLTVVNADVDQADRTRTVTYLPSLSAAGLRMTVSSTKTDRGRATNVERLFGAVSNYNFPTAATVVGESAPTASTATQAGPSAAAGAPKLTLVTQGAISQRQMKQVQSIVSRPNTNMENKTKSVELSIRSQPPKQYKNWCARLCSWEPHTHESRPMYRDDAFYDGNVEKLPIYQKSMADVTPANKTGLEYQMAVSRAVTVNDLQDKKGVFTTAARRVLSTMMDTEILRRRTFQFYCFYGFCIYAGTMVPYVYIKDRNQENGVKEVHCSYFVSMIALSSAVGRILLSAMAMRIDPVALSAWCALVAGISTGLSGISYNLAYQYSYSFIYGMSTSAVNCLRSLVLVKLYGLEKLTNATGMYFLFLGFGNIFSTPLAAALKNAFGYDVAFIVAGIFLGMAGISIFGVMIFERKENVASKKAGPPPPEKQKPVNIPQDEDHEDVRPEKVPENLFKQPNMNQP